MSYSHIVPSSDTTTSSCTGSLSLEVSWPWKDPSNQWIKGTSLVKRFSAQRLLLCIRCDRPWMHQSVVLTVVHYLSKCTQRFTDQFNIFVLTLFGTHTEVPCGVRTVRAKRNDLLTPRCLVITVGWCIRRSLVYADSIVVSIVLCTCIVIVVHCKNVHRSGVGSQFNSPVLNCLCYLHLHLLV